MRTCKKDYFNKILNGNKYCIKGIWNVLNEMIRNGSMYINCPQYFIDNDRTISNMNDVVNGFNNCFVRVGPKLAEEIKNPQQKESEGKVMDFLDSNPNSMFL